MNRYLIRLILIGCSLCMGHQLMAEGIADFHNTIYGAEKFTKLYVDEKGDIEVVGGAGSISPSAAQFHLGNAYYLGVEVPQSYEEAAKWLGLAAAQGYDKAQFLLGWMYLRGYGVPQDYNEAFRLVRLSAEQGHPCGQCILAYMYYLGYGVPANEKEAIKWLDLAGGQRKCVWPTIGETMYHAIVAAIYNAI